MSHRRSAVRVAVRVSPGSRRESIAVRVGDDGRPLLLVRVAARAVDGAANSAVVQAVARALGLHRRQVCVAVGRRSRSKLLDIDADADIVSAAISALPSSESDDPA